MMIQQMVSPESIAGLLVRVFTGILFFFQGYDKVFRMGVKQVYSTISPSYINAGVPAVIVKFTSYLTSYIELTGGLLLILGLAKYYAIYALGFDLVIVAIGMSFLNPVWDLQHVFPRFLLLLFLLIYPGSLDIIGLDHFIF